MVNAPLWRLVYEALAARKGEPTTFGQVVRVVVAQRPGVNVNNLHFQLKGHSVDAATGEPYPLLGDRNKLLFTHLAGDAYVIRRELSDADLRESGDEGAPKDL